MFVSGILFQLGWFVCVLAGNLSSLLYLAVYFFAHYMYFPAEKRVWVSALRVAVVGCLIDAMLFQAGIFQLHSQSLVLPIWLISLWMMFALALHYCFSFLSGRYLLAAILGVIGGPSSYLSGVALAPGLELGLVWWQVFLILAPIWAVLMPYVVWVVDGKPLSNKTEVAHE